MTFQPATFKNLPLGTVQPKGWMLSQLRSDLSHGFAGCLDALTERAATDLFTHRIESSSRQSAWWDSETRGNWLWGYTMMAGLAGLPEHQARAGGLIESLKKTQDPDGYIGIYSPGSRYQHGDDENGELWGQSRALLALLSHYELTGDESSLSAARAAAELTMKQYGPGHSYFRQPGKRNELTGMTHGLCYVDVMDWLYTITAEERYRDFGSWLYQDFSRMQVPFPNDDMALTHLLDRCHPYGGHAVHTVEHLRAVLFAAQAGADDQTKEALQNAFWKLEHYTLPSGAVIGDEGIHGLTLPEMGYEYCTLTELLFSLMSALQKMPDSELGDWVERLAFNPAQGARFADGTALAYLSLDTRMFARNDRADSYSNLPGRHGRFKYSPTHEDVACCCNPNAVRFLPHYISRMWMQTPDGVAAVLYGPCTLKTKIHDVNVTIAEMTDYPFSDSLHFTIDAGQPLDFELALRKPGWSGSVTLDGVDVREQDGWLVIDRKWESGDTFSITFHPQIEVAPYPNGEYAIRRGALQYVYPIEHHLHSIKDYPLPGFHDFEITPSDLEQAYRTIFLEGAMPDFGLVFGSAPAGETDLNWASAPVWLGAGPHRLVPMGCTTLRRASFPLKHAQEKL